MYLWTQSRGYRGKYYTTNDGLECFILLSVDNYIVKIKFKRNADLILKIKALVKKKKNFIVLVKCKYGKNNLLRGVGTRYLTVKTLTIRINYSQVPTQFHKTVLKFFWTFRLCGSAQSKIIFFLFCFFLLKEKTFFMAIIFLECTKKYDVPLNYRLNNIFIKFLYFKIFLREIFIFYFIKKKKIFIKNY